MVCRPVILLVITFLTSHAYVPIGLRGVSIVPYGRKQTFFTARPPPLAGLLSFERYISDLRALDSSEDEITEPAENPSGEVEELTSEAKDMEVSGFRKMWKRITTKSKDGLSTRERFAKLGTSAFLSYGFISNFNMAINTALAWFTASKKTGMSPLAPGQWKGFVAIYGGLYVFSNIFRPIRIGLTLALTKYYDDAVSFLERKMKINRSRATLVMVLGFNVLGTLTLFCGGILLASLASGVAIFPPKA